ncbi:MAG: NAD(P)/FAD-dependent oxidoreductase [Pseudorhodoplanes sp.]
MTQTADIAIIGGGISGLSVAYELCRRKRRRVVILERRHAGYGATSRNIGRVRTSQFSEPLAVFAKEAFAKHARLSDELGSNTLFWTPGYALVFYDREELATIASIRATLDSLQLKTEYYEDGAVLDRLPILRGGRPPVGCLIRPDASVHHDSLLHGYRREAERFGVEIRENVSVTGFDIRNGRVVAVKTSEGDISAGMFVNAAGGWSREISEMAGLKVPNAPLRREVLVTESSRPYMDTMITFYRPVEGWFHQTLRGETVIGVTDADEPLGINMNASERHLCQSAWQILDKAPLLAGLRVVRQWAGVYDMSPDRKSLVGPVNAMPNFVQINGDNGRGIAVVPYISEQLAIWIDSGKRPDSLEIFDVNRYAGKEDTPVVVGDYYSAYQKPKAS